MVSTEPGQLQGEHHADGAGDPLVRIDLDPPGIRPAVAGRQGEAQLAPPGLAVPSLETPLAQQTEFVLGHGALQPKQEAIVDQARIVNAVRIDDQRPSEGAEVDQVVPIPAIAGQTGGFEA